MAPKVPATATAITAALPSATDKPRRGRLVLMDDVVMLILSMIISKRKAGRNLRAAPQKQ
jgi:hypothetical protein